MNFDNLIIDHGDKQIYRDGNKLIKLFGDTYHTSGVLVQALYQERARDLGIKAPKVLEIGKVEGRWAIVSEYVEGKTLEELLKEHPERKEELMERFVLEQIKLFETHSYKFADQLDMFNSGISKTEIDAVTRFAFHRSIDKTKKNSVCHGDFTPYNIIITKDEDWYILDWEKASHGDALYDIATTYIKIKADMGSPELAENYLGKMVEEYEIEAEDILCLVPIVSLVLTTNQNDEEFQEELLKMYMNSALAGGEI